MTTMTRQPETRRIDNPVPPSSWRVAAALARVEGLRVLRHPLWWFGVAASAWLAVLEMSWQVAELVAPTDYYVTRLAEFATPIAMMTLVIAHLAAGRIERDGLADQATSTPSSRMAHRGGLALAQVIPAVAALAIAGGVSAWLSLSTAGAVGVADLLHVSLWVLACGVLGVAVSRLSTAMLAGPLAVVATTVVTYYVLLNDSSMMRRLTPPRDWMEAGAWPGMLPRSPWVHLAMLLGIVIVVALIAIVARGMPRRPVAVMTAWATIGLLAAVGGGLWLQASVDPATTETMRDLFDDPVSGSTCALMTAPIQWCTPVDGLEETRALVDADLQQAIDLLGPSATLHPTSLQVTGYLDQSTRRSIGLPPQPDPRPGAVAVRPRSSRRQLVLETMTQAWLRLDPPPPPSDEEVIASVRPINEDGACSMADQARGAVLLAVADLSATGTPQPLPFFIVEPIGGGGYSYGTTGEFNPGISVGRGTALFSWKQVQVAHHLAEAGPSAVSSLHDDWTRWSDPSTTLDELVTHLDIPQPQALRDTVRAAFDQAGVDAEQMPDVDEMYGFDGQPCT